MQVDVAVVVVTYNSAAIIDELLDSIPAAMGELSYVITIVDNGSVDGTADVIEQRDAQPAAVVLRATNRGYSAGINRGVEASPASEAVLILNPDVRLDASSVHTMMAELRSTGGGLVVPRLRGPDGHRQVSLRRTPTLMRASGLGFTKLPVFSEYVTSDRAYERRHVIEWATGAVVLVARACHDDLDGWDESFFLYSEETDFFLRAADRGWSAWYVPGAGAVHLEGESGRNDETHTMQIVNRVRWYVRRRGTLLGWGYYCLTLLSEASWVVRGHPQSRASITSLLRPSRRPTQLGCGTRLLPR